MPDIFISTRQFKLNHIWFMLWQLYICLIYCTQDTFFFIKQNVLNIPRHILFPYKINMISYEILIFCPSYGSGWNPGGLCCNGSGFLHILETLWSTRGSDHVLAQTISDVDMCAWARNEGQKTISYIYINMQYLYSTYYGHLYSLNTPRKHSKIISNEHLN